MNNEEIDQTFKLAVKDTLDRYKTGEYDIDQAMNVLGIIYMGKIYGGFMKGLKGHERDFLTAIDVAEGKMGKPSMHKFFEELLNEQR